MSRALRLAGISRAARHYSQAIMELSCANTVVPVQSVVTLDCDAHLNPIRTKANAGDVRYSDIEDTLLNMGLCNACAGNAAAWYVYRPSSSTGQLVKAALEGNPLAKQKLQGDVPNYPWNR
jgi:hypothetical protein